MIRLLLDGGADVNNARTDDGCTALYILAAQEGHVEVVRQLLAGGADVSKATNDLSCTPLYEVSHEGNLEVAKLLVDSGANSGEQGEDRRRLLAAVRVFTKWPHGSGVLSPSGWCGRPPSGHWQQVHAALHHS